MPRKLKRKPAWNASFAYAVGLIASDGCLNKDGRKFWLSSKDLELVENLKQALSLTNHIGKYARGGEREKKYFYISFGNVVLHEFLNQIGITPAKSRTIESVQVPRSYFHDFLRGLFDGDGTFYTFRDHRWPNAIGYQVSFASASNTFVSWLKKSLTELYGVKGFIRPGDGVYNLRYVKRDSIRIAQAMYGADLIPGQSLFLGRKYDKIMNAFRNDRLFQKLTKPQ